MSSTYSKKMPSLQVRKSLIKHLFWPPLLLLQEIQQNKQSGREYRETQSDIKPAPELQDAIYWEYFRTAGAHMCNLAKRPL